MSENHRRRDIARAKSLLIHALSMLNELPTSERVGSAILHATGAAVVLGHNATATEHALRFAKQASES